MKNFYLTTLFLLFLSLCLLSNAQTQNVDINKLDKDFEKAIATYNVPGMSVALVTNHKILLKKGYGVLGMKNNSPVDENTLFGIASLTKTFTVAVVANAVKDKKFDFDTKIVDLYPHFKLYDKYVTNEITVADALSHRSGLVSFSGDLIWYGSTISDSVIIRRLRYLQPQYGFRTHFGYSNIFYLLIGNILEREYHHSYSFLVDSLIIKPIGMSHTCVTYEEAMKKKNLAIPHIEKDGQLLIQPYLSWDNMEPAGGIFSSASDLAKYLQMWLNKGVYGDANVINEDQVKELWRQKTPSKLSWLETYLGSPVNFRSFGMGWAMMDYAGYKVLHHSGGLDGMVCHIVVIPEKNLGAVFLSNKTTALPNVLMYHLLDNVLGEGNKDYILRAHQLIQKFKNQETDHAKIYAAPTELKPDFFVGNYYDSLIGKVEISKNKENYTINWTESNIFKGELVQTDMLTFELRWPLLPSLPKGKVIFEVGGEGVVKGFRIDLPNPDLHFDELYFSHIQE